MDNEKAGIQKMTSTRKTRRRVHVDKCGVLKEIEFLLKKAVSAAEDGDVEWARFLTRQAFVLSQRTNVRIPRKLKRLFCKKCFTPLLPGVTARCRLHAKGKRSYISVTCLICGNTRRYQYKPRKRP